MKRQNTIYITIAAAIALFLAMGGLTSCSDDTTEPVNSVEDGTLRMTLVDAPVQIQDVDSLVVVFDRVMVHRCEEEIIEGEEEWITVLPDTLPVQDRTFNLLELVNGVFATLGEVELEPGTYTQVRIMLESASLVINGEDQDLFIPSGYESGIKLVHAFKIEPDVITDLVVDFDVASSLHEAPPGSGNYILRPTIRLVQKTLSGTISGTVTPVGIGSVVYALEPFTMDTIATTLPDSVSGHYVLQALLESSYDVRAEAEGYQDSTITGVTVTAGENTPDIDFELIPASN